MAESVGAFAYVARKDNGEQGIEIRFCGKYDFAMKFDLIIQQADFRFMFPCRKSNKKQRRKFFRL
jgi:hypothetical protein